MNHGVLKESGKITGYKAHLYPILSDDTIKKSRKKQQDELKRADYALEAWARWYLSKHGYNQVCSLARMNETAKGFEWHIPNGVEVTREVANVIRVFDVMKESNHHGYVLLLRFYLTRDKNEGIRNYFKRLNIENYRVRFAEAKKEFANRLGML